MIKINITNETLKDIKNIFRKWFFQRDNNIQEFKNIIDRDEKLRKIIFYEDNEKYTKYIKKLNNKKDNSIEKKMCQSLLEEFFFARFDEEKSIERYIPSMELKFNEETEAFFLNKYDNFRNSQAVKLIRKLNIRVCPYCNRNYMELYNEGEKGKIAKHVFKGELDHYFPKSQYPHLAISVFNLIPCCKICNHEKHENDSRVLYPYSNNNKLTCKFTLSMLTDDDEFDITFNEKIHEYQKNDVTYIQGTSDNFKINIKSIDSEFNDLVRNSNKAFKLEKKYNSSKSYVKELLRKRYIYTEEYANILSGTFNEVFKAPEDVKKTIFSNELNESDYKDRPLSKLTYDILKELNEI